MSREEMSWLEAFLHGPCERTPLGFSSNERYVLVGENVSEALTAKVETDVSSKVVPRDINSRP